MQLFPIAATSIETDDPDVPTDIESNIVVNDLQSGVIGQNIDSIASNPINDQTTGAPSGKQALLYNDIWC